MISSAPFLKMCLLTDSSLFHLATQCITFNQHLRKLPQPFVEVRTIAQFIEFRQVNGGQRKVKVWLLSRLKTI